jgi:Transposase DDE domain
MHVVTTRRHYKDRVYETHLLRRSFREGGQVRNQTLANLSHLPAETIELIRRSLRGETLVAAADAFRIDRSRPHGHVAAVWAMAGKLGLPALLGPACRQRDLAVALIIARACKPGSKLATLRWWADTTLAPDLGVEGADADDLYAAMDWLLQQQPMIEQRLARRHLHPGGLVLYDVASSWLEGRTCPLAAFGYSRDGKQGKPQIVYGLVTDPDGRPVAVNVFAGDTGDPTAFAATVQTVTTRLGLDRVVLVGDRGMITFAGVQALGEREGMDWITALRAPAVKRLAAQGAIQLSLFDQTNLAEIAHPDYPEERLVVCRNPALGADRARKRGELLAATDTKLDKIVVAVQAGRLTDAGKIGVRVGRVINRYKMAKHYTLDIATGRFAYTHDQATIAAEAALDGVYVLRTSVTSDRLDTPGVVTAYKRLAGVERDFRSLKAVDLDVRPIHHRLEDRVRGHLLVCMLAAYLVWHLRQAWAPLCYTDEHPPGRPDPVAPTRRSPAAQHKASRHTTNHDEVAHSFGTLIDHLACLSRDDITVGDTGTSIQQLAQPTPTQQRAFDLLGAPIPLRLS